MPLFIDFCFVFFGSQKNQIFHTRFRSYLYGECACVWVRVRKPCVRRDWFIMFVTKICFIKRTEQKRRNENSQTAQTELLFFGRGPKVAGVDFYPQWNIQCVFHFGMTYWWYCRQCCLLAFASFGCCCWCCCSCCHMCARECYVMKCVAVDNMTCACFSKRWWDIELVLSEPLICSPALSPSFPLLRPSVRSKFEIIIALLTQNPI